MFPKKSILCLDGAIRQSSLENSEFIQKIREEDRRDKILEDAFLRSNEENPYHKEIESSIKLCSELKEAKRKRFVAERRNMVRRQNGEELKKLEIQLRAAYISKTIAAQKFERQALKEQSKISLHIQNIGLAESRFEQNEYATKLEDTIRQKKQALKADLQDQMAEMNAKREQVRLDKEQEKKMIENAVQNYKDECEKEEREALAKKLRIKAEMHEFLSSQEKWKLAQHAATQQEEEKLQEFLRNRVLERQKAKQQKKERQDHKNKISEAIGKRTHAITVEKFRSMDALTELLIDERRAKEETKSLRDQERQVRDRISIRADLDRIHQLKETRRQAQKKEDEECNREQKRKLVEMEKIQQMEDEQKKSKALEYRLALQSDLDEKKRLKAEEMNRLIMAERAEVATVNRREQLSDLQRIDMLKEHAPGLKGFLPPRMLRPSDREHLSL